MLINWFTVGAQIVNFLVLLALLKWVLFDRITRAMDDRQRTIADRLEEARRKQAEAEQHEQELQRKHRELDEKRQQMLDEARQQADERREELFNQARGQVDQSRQQWQDELAAQERQFLDDVTRRASEALRDSVRRALRDLADAKLDRQIASHFISQLQHIEDETRDEFRAAHNEADNRVRVTTATELPDDLREQLAAALHQLATGNRELDVSFDISGDLVAGIEVRVGGHALGWNLRQYLDRFADNLRQHLERQQ